MYLYELRKGDSFTFRDTKYPSGVQKSINCWGVQIEKKPIEPWMILCRDVGGRIHSLTLSPMVEVDLAWDKASSAR